MKLDNDALKVIRTYLDDPTDQRALYGLSTIYWSSLITAIGECIHSSGDIQELLHTEHDFINSGIIDKILEDADAIRSKIRTNTASYKYLSVQMVTDWLQETLRKISAGDKKELLQRDIKNIELQQKRIDSEITDLQQKRKNLLLNIFSANADKTILTQIENLVTVDYLTFQNLQTQKEIAKGVFFTVDNRREFVARTNQLQKENEKKDELFAKVKSSDDKTTLRKYTSNINELFEKSIGCTDLIVKKENC